MSMQDDSQNYIVKVQGLAYKAKKIGEREVCFLMTEFKLRYCIRCDTDCQFCIESVGENFKKSFELIHDNAKHSITVMLPKTGNYRVYIQSEIGDVIMYEILIKNL